jgi:hypothetical protein
MSIKLSRFDVTIGRFKVTFGMWNLSKIFLTIKCASSVRKGVFDHTTRVVKGELVVVVADSELRLFMAFCTLSHYYNAVLLKGGKREATRQVKSSPCNGHMNAVQPALIAASYIHTLLRPHDCRSIF